MAKKKETEKVKPVIEVVKDEKKELGKPTPEQVAQYKLDFDNAIAEFTEARFPVSESGSFKANDQAMFLLDYLKKFAMWSKTGWMGVVKMEEELRKAQMLDNEKTGLTFDYQTLEFCGYMLMNPGSVGYESAVEFEKIADRYSQVMSTIGEQVEIARAQLQKVQFLQEKWAAGEQGFFIADVLKPPTPQEVEGIGTDGEVIDTPDNPGIVIDATKKD